MVEIFTLFPFTFFDTILMVKKSTSFALTCFYDISIEKSSMLFLLSCRNNCRKSACWVFTEQLLYNIIFGWLQVALVKKCNKPLLEKREEKIFEQTKFCKKLVQSQRKNNLGILRINQKISKMLTICRR